MTSLSFWGASDDLLEVELGGTVIDEIGCYDRPVTVTVYDGDGAGVVVEYQHCGKTGWRATTVLVPEHEDGRPMVPLKLSMSETGYSPRVDIDLPNGAGVTFEVGGRVIATIEGGTLERVEKESP